MVCEHRNLGAPAVGNHYIALSLLRYISLHKPTCVIVTWTSHDKLDVFVEDPALAEEIQTYPSRNFLVDWDGDVIDTNNAWWPSSVSKDNPIKLAHGRWASDKFYAMTTLQSVMMVQQYCKTNSIPLYQYMSYEWPLESWQTDPHVNWLHDMIDWSAFGKKILADDYYASEWMQYQHRKKYGLIPTAGWHAEFFSNDILPILRQHFTIGNIKVDQLVDAARSLSQKLYDEDTNNS